MLYQNQVNCYLLFPCLHDKVSEYGFKCTFIYREPVLNSFPFFVHFLELNFTSTLQRRSKSHSLKSATEMPYVIKKAPTATVAIASL